MLDLRLACGRGDGHRPPSASDASPAVAITSLIAFNVIHPSLRVAIPFGVALLILDRLGWRVTSAMFDRERLIVGTNRAV